MPQAPGRIVWYAALGAACRKNDLSDRFILYGLLIFGGWALVRAAEDGKAEPCSSQETSLIIKPESSARGSPPPEVAANCTVRKTATFRIAKADFSAI